MFNIRNKIIFVICVTAVIISVGGVLVWSELQRTKTADEEARLAGERVLELKKDNIEKNVGTSNWQTYRNEKYGFEVRYPQEFSVDLKTITDTLYMNEIRRAEARLSI